MLGGRRHKKPSKSWRTCLRGCATNTWKRVKRGQITSPAKAKDLGRVAQNLGFEKTRQRGSHARWRHLDGRSTTIPSHGNAEVGGWLFRKILKQLGIDEDEFQRLC
ncbi:MAG: type II toxin-antitoxin system HicA family toxin [Leptolyngbyaceae cyanobacterium T60_A2020_046]|nr:type II toxin-antitoxin system HicA family toxin [Leptolyngbyaceae cyanobacterium T60_A2020_046]